MNRRRLIARASWIAAGLAVLLPASGCDRTDLAGPPTLRLGRDECAECGMMINEDRCSSACLVDRNGVREHVVFDDIGCMLDWEVKESRDATIVDGFVHDHATKAWLPSKDAAFLSTERERLSTPMGSGIVAFATSAQAEAAQAEFGGRTMRYAELIAARKAWQESRQAEPQVQPTGATHDLPDR